MSKFEYPRLPRSEIVTVLAESQIADLTENDIKNPTPEFAWELYTRLLIYLGALSEEDQGQVEFSALEQLENPDLCIGSFPVINLYSRIKDVVAALDCPLKFTLKDLIKPDAARTEFFIGTILNFCLHKDTKMNLIRPIADELALLDEQRKEWDNKISQLNAEIASYNEVRQSESSLVQEVDAKVKELRQTVTSLNSQQMSLRASCRKLKEKSGEMDKKISEAEFELVQSVQENANLRSRIVQSPDKLQSTLEEKKSAREEAKNAEMSAMQTFLEKSAVLDVHMKVFKKMSKHLAQMQAIQEQVNSAKAVEKEYKILKEKLSDDEVLFKSLEPKLVERQGKAEELDELSKQLERERDLKFEESTKKLDEVKLQVESLRRDLEMRQRKVKHLVAEVDSITAKTKTVNESRAAKVQLLESKCAEVVQQYRQYVNSIGELLPEFENN